MINFENFEAMINAIMPKDFNDKEQAFFRKWYRKFHINNDMNTNEFLKFIQLKGIDNKSFRDRLYHFGGICYQKNNDNILKYTPNERKVFVNEQNNQVLIANSIEFMLDEIELTDKMETKISCIKKAGSFVIKLYKDFSYTRLDVIKLIAKYFKLLEGNNYDFINEILNLTIRLELNEKDIEWVNKQKKKYEVKQKS